MAVDTDGTIYIGIGDHIEVFAPLGEEAQNLEPPAQIIGSDAYRIGMRLLAESDLLVMVSPALIAPELAGPDPELVQLKIDKPTIRRHASLIYAKERPLSTAARLLLDEVKLQVQQSRLAMAQ